MQEEKPEPPKSLEPRARKILLAAAELFIVKGFHQTSTRDIARKAGVSLGNLYNHFPGKSELIQSIAILEREDHAPFLVTLGKKGDPEKVVTRFVDAYFSWAAHEENVVLGAEIGAEVVRNPDAAQPFLQNRDVLENALLKVAQRAKPETESVHVALVLELINGASLRASGRPRQEIKKMKTALKETVRALLF